MLTRESYTRAKSELGFVSKLLGEASVAPKHLSQRNADHLLSSSGDII